MPRTVESIVECHQEATRRRSAGRPIWDLSLPLGAIKKDYEAAGDDLTIEQAVELSRRIGAMLQAGVPASWRKPESPKFSYDYEEMFERFQQAEAADFTPTKDWKDTPCDTVNAWLDELYDWGDRCRVWLM